MHTSTPGYLRVWLNSLAHWHFVPHQPQWGRYGVPRQARRAGITPGMIAPQAAAIMRQQGW